MWSPESMSFMHNGKYKNPSSHISDCLWQKPRYPFNPPIITLCYSQSFHYSVSYIFFRPISPVTYLCPHSFMELKSYPHSSAQVKTASAVAFPACSSMLCSLTTAGVICEPYSYIHVFNCSRLELCHIFVGNFFIPTSSQYWIRE